MIIFMLPALVILISFVAPAPTRSVATEFGVAHFIVLFADRQTSPSISLSKRRGSGAALQIPVRAGRPGGQTTSLPHRHYISTQHFRRLRFSAEFSISEGCVWMAFSFGEGRDEVELAKRTQTSFKKFWNS